jgi:transposase, IS5 family
MASLKLVWLAKLSGVPLRQSYARVGKFVLIQHQRYAHAKQFKRANRMLKKLRTYLGHVIRDIARKIEGDSGLEAGVCKSALAGTACARAEAASARTQGLSSARAGSRMQAKNSSASRRYVCFVKCSISLSL